MSEAILPYATRKKASTGGRTFPASVQSCDHGPADGQTFAGVRSLRVLSGAGPDQIDFEIEQSASFDVFVDTGSGDSAIQVK